MLVDVRPVNRLQGKTPVDAGAVLTPVINGMIDAGCDLSRAHVVCDWVQYRNNFRETVAARPVLDNQGEKDRTEVAIDLRRAQDVDVRAEVTAALSGAPGRRAADGLVLEDWGLLSKSCIWDFNALYWQHLDLWEKATGRAYEQALPGGASDARNVDGVREILLPLFDVWDELAARRALPEELYVVELGVGNGGQALTWLDEFMKVDAERGTEYYRRLHYLMCDYSPYVLELARETVKDHCDRVSSFVLDATKPLDALSFLQYKVFLVYVSNVYDNLPTDEIAHIGDRVYSVETRAYVPTDAVSLISSRFGIEREDLGPLVAKLLRIGPALTAEAAPQLLPDVDAAVALWQELWAAIRLDERYVPLPGLDFYQVAPEVNGEMLRPFVGGGADVRMHVNNGTVASFVDTLRLLHPYGRLISHDIFVTDIDSYRHAFRGPGKYEGSVVAWINGPLLAHIGRRFGYDVSFRSFEHRTGTNIVTLTATAQD